MDVLLFSFKVLECCGAALELKGFIFNRNNLEALTSIRKVRFPPALISMLGDKRTGLNWLFVLQVFLSKFGFFGFSEDTKRGSKSTKWKPNSPTINSWVRFRLSFLPVTTALVWVCS